MSEYEETPPIGVEYLAGLRPDQSWLRECMTQPAPLKGLATDEQRLYMNALQLGLPAEIRKRWYWTLEEVADPKMTYSEAEKAIAYLKREGARGYRCGIYPPRRLYEDKKPKRDELFYLI